MVPPPPPKILMCPAPFSWLDHPTESILFHAGTKLAEGQVQTSGGRVLAVTSFGNKYSDALKTSYTTIKNISFDGMNYRKDLGFDL